MNKSNLPIGFLSLFVKAYLAIVFLFGRAGLKSTNLKAVAQLCERVNLVLASVLASVF